MSLSKDLILLILQFCNEENLTKTAHMLEQETGIFFDLKHFEDLVLTGNWDEAQNYLSNFTAVSDNKHSLKMYFEIRKQKFLEALDRQDRHTALDILLKDLKEFAPSNEELYREMAHLLTLDDFREHAPLALYGDAVSSRKRMMSELKLIIESNPQFQGRINFPPLNKSRLRRLINQSLNWQHMRCANPQPEPEIKTLFTDHKCPTPDDEAVSLSEKMLVPSKSISSVGELAFPQTLYSSIGTDEMISATTPKAVLDSTNLYDVSSTRNMNERESVPDQNQAILSGISEEFPKAVARVLDLDSSPTAMDFHPLQQTLLIVGNSVGDVELWDICSGVMLFSRKFMISNVEALSTEFLVKVNVDPSISVSRILWSSDGSLFGVAFSKNIVQLYSYDNSDNEATQYMEIDAHSGTVNDLAFSKPHNQLLIITCGEDKLVKVWNTATGVKEYTFEGHGAPVLFLCAHEKENYHFVFSTSTNGEIKAWLFEDWGPRVSYEAPDNCCMRMLYSADGKGLFSCGTNKNGESHMVEWNDSEGYINTSYIGLGNCYYGVVPFDICGNKYLAAGDAHVIKVWKVNEPNRAIVVDAGGDLPAHPYIRFNKKGTLLAVFANNKIIKILANDCGLFLLETSLDASRYLSDSIRKLTCYSNGDLAHTGAHDDAVPLVHSEGKTADNLEDMENMETHQILGTPSISNVIQTLRCQVLRLPSEVKTDRVWRLMYTHAGNALLVLVEGGMHVLWKWLEAGSNSSGQATTQYAPQLWKARSGGWMTNSVPNSDTGAVSPCLALSKNDSYAVSASGGMVSVFNILTCKKLKSVMPPAPTATCIAFYPSDNNLIAVGLDDSTIIVYNVRLDQVVSKLEGHSKRITGLAFSNILDVLVSSGIDSQIVVWDSIGWKMERSCKLQISADWFPAQVSETLVQFHQDQKQFLVVHETQIAIYEATKLECVNQWIIRNFCARILHATFSCNCQWVYAVLKDGVIMILSASDLSPRFEIDPSSFAAPDFSNYASPVVVAAHPQNPDQFALGLADGVVAVVEPETEAGWIVPLERGDDNEATKNEQE